MNTLIIDDITIEKTTKAMVFHSGEPFSTTKTIGEIFGKKHTEVIEKVKNFKSYDEMLRVGKIRPLFLKYRGQNYQAFELDADAFTFVCMSFTGKKAEMFKWAFIQSYKQVTAEAFSAKITANANHANMQWIEARTKGKNTRIELQKKIKEFCTYAEEQRGKPYRSCPYYKLITSAIYSYLGIDIPKGGKTPRDVYSGDIVEAIEYAELEIMELLDEIMLLKKSRKGIKDHIVNRLKKQNKVA